MMMETQLILLRFVDIRRTSFPDLDQNCRRRPFSALINIALVMSKSVEVFHVGDNLGYSDCSLNDIDDHSFLGTTGPPNIWTTDTDHKTSCVSACLWKASFPAHGRIRFHSCNQFTRSERKRSFSDECICSSSPNFARCSRGWTRHHTFWLS